MNNPMPASHDSVRLEDLPDTVRDLVDVIGIKAAMCIVEKRGGIRLYVPKAAKDDHSLSMLIGLDNLEELVKIYGGEEIEIPRCEKALRAVQQRQIISELQTGSSAEVALKHGYTERGLRLMKRRAEARGELKTNQMDLFNS